MALYKSVYYYNYFDPGTQFPGDEKNYAMQYKKSTKIKLEWTLLLLLLLIIIIIIIFSPPAQSHRQEN